MSPAKAEEDPPVLNPNLGVRALLFGVAYFACAVLGGTFSLQPGSFVPFWLPSGLFVAVLLFHERRHWLAFVLAASLANTSFDLLNGQALHTSLLFFLGNSLEALAGAWLVRRFVAERPTLDSLREVVGFIVCSALISTTVSATLGAWVVTDLLKSGSYWHTWLLWFSGDVIGISLLSPLLMAWRSGFNHPAHGPWSRRSTHEAIFILAVTLGAVFLFT
jgi:integral membrane sensor domain MASE1